MKLAYDAETGRITRTFWKEDITPGWFEDPPEGCDVAEEPDFSQESRGELLRERKEELRSSDEYDPEEHTVSARLYYDPEEGEIYAEGDIEDAPDDDL